MASISYAVTVCNEIDELTQLLNFLQLHIREEDEIVIQYDEASVTKDVMDYLNLINVMHSNHKVVGFSLNNDFASFKNNLKSHCSKDYIFQIDADEQIPPSLLFMVRKLIVENDCDCLWIPRINIINGHTQKDIAEFNWTVAGKNWIQFPDYQIRVFKANGDIKWHENVHEEVRGYRNKIIICFKNIISYLSLT
mgnify:CR=1 FL=1